MAAAGACRHVATRLFEDNLESLLKIIQKRLHRRQPLLVYVNSIPEDPAGPASAEFSLRDLVNGWMADNDFQSAGPAEADVIINQGPISYFDNVRFFVEATDWSPFHGEVSALARRICLALISIIHSDVGKGYADVHFYTYQQ